MIKGMDKETPQVFISYSRRDADLARGICNILDRNKITYFLDTKNINWGAKVNKDVRKALLSCIAIVVIVSPASQKSQWVAYELGHAVALNKIILPLLSHPDLDLPQFIHELNYKTSLSEVNNFFSNDYRNLSQEQVNPSSTQAKYSQKAFLSEALEAIENIKDKFVSKKYIEALRYSLKETGSPMDIPSAIEIINKFGFPCFALLNHDIILNSSSARIFLHHIGISINKNHFAKLLSGKSYLHTFSRRPYCVNGKNIFTYSEIMRLIGVKKEMFSVPNKLR